MNPFVLIAENRIREAMENGEFDNLPGQGQPIDFSEDEHIPADQRLAYRILKKSGHHDRENNIKKQLRDLKDETKASGANAKEIALAKLTDYKEAQALARKLR